MCWGAVAVGIGVLNGISSRNQARNSNRAQKRLEELEKRKFR